MSNLNAPNSPLTLTSTLQCNVKKIKRKLMAIAAGLINHNSMQCGIGVTEERSCDDSGTAIKAPIEFRGYLERRGATS